MALDQSAFFPFNKEKVINKLPNLPKENELIKNIEQPFWSEVFVEILSDLRNPEKKVMKQKGEKLIVPAGKSI